MNPVPFGPNLAQIDANYVLDQVAPDPGARALDQPVDYNFLAAKRKRVGAFSQMNPTAAEIAQAYLLLHNAEHRVLGAAGIDEDPPAYFVEFVNQVSRRLDQINLSIIRGFNASARDPTDRVDFPPNNAGNQPAPKTLGEIQDASEADLIQLITFYGLQAGDGDEPTYRRHFKAIAQHIGLRSV